MIGAGRVVCIDLTEKLAIEPILEETKEVNISEKSILGQGNSQYKYLREKHARPVETSRICY